MNLFGVISAVFNASRKLLNNSEFTLTVSSASLHNPFPGNGGG